MGKSSITFAAISASAQLSFGKNFDFIWIDSRQTRMSSRQSEQKFDGKEIVLFSKELGGKAGRKSRTVTRLEDEGKKIVHRQFGINSDGTERLVMELVLTKTAARKE